MSQFSTPFSRRGLLGLSAGAAAAFGLAGCAMGTKDPANEPSSGGAESSPSASAAGKVMGGTLSILAADSDFKKEEMEAFEKEHQCDIKIDEYTFDKLSAMLAANRPPDLVLGNAAPDAPYIASKGLAEALDDRVAASDILKADDLADVNNYWRSENGKQGEGPLYGLVKDYSSDLGLWINTKLVGETPSSTEVMTYDKVQELARKAFKESSGRVENYGYEYYNFNKPSIMHLQAMIYSDGEARLFNDDLSEIDLTTEQGVKALDFFRPLFEEKLTNSALATSTADAYELFTAGRLGIMQAGYWMQGVVTDYEPAVRDAIVFCPAPQLGANRISPVLGGRGLWMPKDAKNKDLAWAFMEYYFGGAPAQNRASSGWGVPSLKSLQDQMPQETPLNKMAYAVQQEENNYMKTLSFTPFARADACDLLLKAAMESGIKDGKTTKDIAADMNKQINDLLRRGKR